LLGDGIFIETKQYASGLVHGSTRLGKKPMIEIDILLLFLTTSILLALAPGPDNLFVMAQAAQRGRLAGLIVTLGLCTGLLVHTSAVAFGLAAVIQTSVFAFTVLKMIGAGYLLFLAWQAFRAVGETGSSGKIADIDMSQLYRRGIIMNITNPKVSIFFLAFLPQFVDPNKGTAITQFMILGGLFIIATIIVFGCISLLAGAIGEKFRKSSKAQKLLNWIAGTIFTGLALKLLVSEQ
jgi:threonine/homoserine/homoserine lactone efflux protein